MSDVVSWGGVVFDRPYSLLFVIYTTGMHQLKIMTFDFTLVVVVSNSASTVTLDPGLIFYKVTK